ncbi:DUF6541 family protein [Brachybacterium nesterenkovii]|uniref:DUF6541 family protein n=1 Tax=Brachybacterium nesterenkovii TaxID=47847 RepID=UPI00321AE88D
MPWLLDALALLAATAVLTLPGLAVTRPLRLGALATAALTAPCSIGIIVVAAEASAFVRIPWTPLSPLLLAAVIALALSAPALRREGLSLAALADPRLPGPRELGAVGVASARSLARRARRDPWSFFATSAGERTAMVAGLVAGGGILGLRMLSMMGSLHAVTQTYDGIFHLNAVRRILDLGSASAWTVGSLSTEPGTATFYPAAWHQTTSLIAQLCGGDIVRATDALLLLVTAVVWPLGLVLLVRTCTSAGPLGLAATGLLSSVSLAFPMAPSSFGILLPYTLAITMVPAALTMLVQLLDWNDSPSPSRSVLLPRQILLLVPPVGIAVALAHPQAVPTLIVLGLPIVLWSTCLRVARWGEGIAARRAAVIALAGALAVFIVCGRVWAFVRPSRSSAGWEPTSSVPEAIGQTLSLQTLGGAPWWPLGLLVIAAALSTLLLSRDGWIVASWVWAVLLAVVGLSMRDLDYRYVITGAWYSDINRVMAVPVIAAIPMLALGLDAAARALARARVLPRTAVAPVAGVCVILLVLGLGAWSPSTAERYRHEYAPWWQNQGLLSDDERELIEEDVPRLVPEGETLAVDPWDGGALAYALADYPVMAPFAIGHRSPEVEVLTHRLQDIDTDPAVCDAAATLGIHHVLDFGPTELWGTEFKFPGIDAVGDDPAAATEVARRGDAALLRLQPCTRSDGSTWG